jgi:Family of unknown function (DUF6535)
VTVLDLKPNSQDTSAFHLNNIQQLLADPNISRASIPSQPPPFSPPLSAIWVNSLLFLSLVISLTCALLATLLQQWARRYLSFTQQQGYSPHKRARIRAFFSDGVDKFHVSWVVEALPALLHLSLCLFLAGILVWLFNLNISVFRAVVWTVALSAIAYMWITFLPIFRNNSPYYAPLSSTLWFLYTGIPYAVSKVLSSPVLGISIRFDGLKEYYCERLSDGIGKTAEKTAWQMASEIDVRILESTLDAPGEDGARARFFEAIPGFFDSDQVQVKDLEEHLLNDFQTKFRRELHGFLDSTFSSNLVSESTRSFQLIICLNAVYAVLGFDGVSQVLYHIINDPWPALLQSVEVAHSLRRWSGPDGQFAPLVRRIVIQVIAGVQERDERWISLTEAEIGVPDYLLREDIRHGDSTLLSLLIHVTRQAFSSGSWTQFTLYSLTQFDICDTRPELQHEFCDLWNEIVREALRGGPDSTSTKILREIRHAYIELHRDTDAAPTAFSARTYHFDPALEQPLSYHVCNIASHRQDRVPQGPVINHLSIPTPTRAAFGTSAASTTQVGGSPNPSPRSIPIEIQRNPRKADIVIISPSPSVIQTVSQQTDEANVVLRFPSSTDLVIKHSDHTSPHAHAFRPSTPVPVYITGPSVPESIGTVKAFEGSHGLHPLPSIGLSYHTSQSALSVADANHVRAEDTADPYSGGIEETFQPSVVASLPYLHLDPLTIVDPSALPHSFSVPDSDGVLEASQYLAWAATPPRPPESNQRRDMAVPYAASDTSQNPSTANHISWSILSSGATFQKDEEITVVPTTVVSDSDSQSSSILMSADPSGVITAEHPSSTEPACIQSDHIAQPLGSPSSSLSMTRSHISPQSSVIDSPTTPSSGAFLSRGATPELKPPIPPISLKIFSDSRQSAPPALNLVAGTSPPGN